MSDKREKIVDTAIELFSRDGFHATGIDTIVAESGITKRTLYHHFASKDELVIAALKKHHQAFVNNFGAGVMNASDSPKKQLLAVFDVAHAWFSSNNFYGCMFINAVGEFAETKDDVRTVAQEFKTHVRNFIIEVAKEAGAKNPKDLAVQLALLLEGSIVTAQVSGSPESATNAKVIAKKLIDDALN